MSGPLKAAPPIPNRLELPIGNEMVLRVDFDRAGDRWRHRVLLVVPEGTGVVGPVLLLESLEGTSEHDWPVSPPLQFVSIETRPKKPPVALLMGMSGDGHWSASIEQLPAERTIRFDIACRAKSRPENLGSRYRLAPRAALKLASEEAGLVAFTAAGQTFEILSDSGPDSSPPTLAMRENELRVHFAEPVKDDAQTYRWMYRLRCTLTSDL